MAEDVGLMANALKQQIGLVTTQLSDLLKSATDVKFRFLEKKIIESGPSKEITKERDYCIKSALSHNELVERLKFSTDQFTDGNLALDSLAWVDSCKLQLCKYYDMSAPLSSCCTWKNIQDGNVSTVEEKFSILNICLSNEKTNEPIPIKAKLSSFLRLINALFRPFTFDGTPLTTINHIDQQIGIKESDIELNGHDECFDSVGDTYYLHASNPEGTRNYDCISSAISLIECSDDQPRKKRQSKREKNVKLSWKKYDKGSSVRTLHLIPTAEQIMLHGQLGTIRRRRAQNPRVQSPEDLLLPVPQQDSENAKDMSWECDDWFFYERIVACAQNVDLYQCLQRLHELDDQPIPTMVSSPAFEEDSNYQPSTNFQIGNYSEYTLESASDALVEANPKCFRRQSSADIAGFMATTSLCLLQRHLKDLIWDPPSSTLLNLDSIRLKCPFQFRYTSWWQKRISLALLFLVDKYNRREFNLQSISATLENNSNASCAIDNTDEVYQMRLESLPGDRTKALLKVVYSSCNDTCSPEKSMDCRSNVVTYAGQT